MAQNALTTRGAARCRSLSGYARNAGSLGASRTVAVWRSGGRDRRDLGLYAISESALSFIRFAYRVPCACFWGRGIKRKYASLSLLLTVIRLSRFSFHLLLLACPGLDDIGLASWISPHATLPYPARYMQFAIHARPLAAGFGPLLDSIRFAGCMGWTLLKPHQVQEEDEAA